MIQQSIKKNQNCNSGSCSSYAKFMSTVQYSTVQSQSTLIDTRKYKCKLGVLNSQPLSCSCTFALGIVFAPFLQDVST